MIKLILFDYDGVIVDSFPTIHKVYGIMAKELGVKNFPATIEGFRKVYGYHYRECYENLGIPVEKYKQAEQIFKREIVKQKPKIFTGIGDVLEKLSKKYTLTLVSANHKTEIEQKLKKNDLRKYFSVVTGVETVGKRFKKAEIYGIILDEYNVSVDEVIAIGDRDIDVNNAQKAGIKNILIVNYGWGHSGNNEQTQAINEPKDIIKAIEKLTKKLL